MFFTIQSFVQFCFPVMYSQPGEKEAHYLGPWKLHFFLCVYCFGRSKIFNSNLPGTRFFSLHLCYENCEGVSRTWSMLEKTLPHDDFIFPTANWRASAFFVGGGFCFFPLFFLFSSFFFFLFGLFSVSNNPSRHLAVVIKHLKGSLMHGLPWHLASTCFDVLEWICVACIHFKISSS